MVPRPSPAIIVLTLLVLMPPGSARAGRRPPRCPGSLAKSCVRKLYRGFDGAGACTRDVARYFTEGRVTDCWSNGAYATLDGFLGDAGASEVWNARGRQVLRGATTGGLGGGAITVDYTRGKRAWRIMRNATGDWHITCPGRATEDYTAAEITAGGCGPITDCALGSCPLPAPE